MQEPIFIRHGRKNFAGGYFPQVSTYGGPIYEAYLAIAQDPKTKNWWIRAGNVNIGYYPAALFSNLGSASIVGWGGRTKAKVGGLSPPMGSGHVPDGNRAHASYFRSPKINRAPGEPDYIPANTRTGGFSDNTNCYGVYYYYKSDVSEEGVIQFGGPGGKCGIIPKLYGDARTHFYTGWTSDDFQKTGCYNTKCRGFVQVDTKIFPGKYFADISKIGGPTYETYMAITQDPKTKNWWISLGNVSIGYYPATLFSNLGSASIVGWGGRTRANVGDLSPPMGSGHFPDGNKTHASYFRSPKIQDASRYVYEPDTYMIKVFSDNTNCYGFEGDFDKVQHERIFQFGGPGGKCGI
ncbi:hypothetical protein DEO72_LG5g2389 [Vigna unguiculata]|uniref:Neprosin PEP catalytic domain-containing protein n=1 Tax=Vigna unguiculata TaxID=3917 RepID=A0A4D6M289_VIGUN|nr:hypothetical protein DEO72_LG5g2389 [Vigna unguiculata]